MPFIAIANASAYAAEFGLIARELLPRPPAPPSAITVATRKSSINADLANFDSVKISEGLENVVLCNLGVQEAALPLPLEATWKENYQYIIDAFVAAMPNVKIYLVKPWGRELETNVNTLAGWIDDLIAANPATCFAGHDERSWVKGVDDGATMTYDGLHYSAAGMVECAAQWKTILGY